MAETAFHSPSRAKTTVVSEMKPVQKTACCRRIACSGSAICSHFTGSRRHTERFIYNRIASWCHFASCTIRLYFCIQTTRVCRKCSGASGSYADARHCIRLICHHIKHRFQFHRNSSCRIRISCGSKRHCRRIYVRHRHAAGQRLRFRNALFSGRRIIIHDPDTCILYCGICHWSLPFYFLDGRYASPSAGLSSNIHGSRLWRCTYRPARIICSYLLDHHTDSQKEKSAYDETASDCKGMEKDSPRIMASICSSDHSRAFECIDAVYQGKPLGHHVSFCPLGRKSIDDSRN